jgi:hypothetical protein
MDGGVKILPGTSPSDGGVGNDAQGIDIAPFLRFGRNDRISPKVAALRGQFRIFVRPAT